MTKNSLSYIFKKRGERLSTGQVKFSRQGGLESSEEQRVDNLTTLLSPL